MSLLLLLLLPLVALPPPPGWSLLRIDPVSARTVVRAWHDVHVSRSIPHDFEHALGPAWAGFASVAAVRHGEARAVAFCCCEEGDAGRPPVLAVRCICTPPLGGEGGSALVHMLGGEEGAYSPDWKSLRAQPMWYILFSYYVA